MKSEIQISNSVANVIKFLAIEILLALLIEPTIAEINRIRAQRLALSGKVVHVKTSFLTRDFSGPVVGGKQGILYKIFILLTLLGALMATEFAFDYQSRAVYSDRKITLTGLSDTAEIEVDAAQVESLSATYFNLVQCASVEDGFILESRIRPDGQCYQRNSTGFRFPEPCVKRFTDSAICERKGNKLVKSDDSRVVHGVVEGIEYYDQLNASNVTYIFLSRKALLDRYDFYGTEEEQGEDIRHCSSRTPPDNADVRICLTRLRPSGDILVSGFDVSQLQTPLLPNIVRNAYARPQLGYSPVLRLGADTFTEAGCAGCITRVHLIVDFLVTVLYTSVIDFGVLPNVQEYGRVLAMIAMGAPVKEFDALDDRSIQQGFLVVDWKFVLPLVIITVAALGVRLSGLMVKEVVRLPMDYSSAMQYASRQDVVGRGPSERRLRNTFKVGLEEACEENTLYLSVNAKHTVSYIGQDIEETNAYCGLEDCKRCAKNQVVFSWHSDQES